MTERGLHLKDKFDYILQEYIAHRKATTLDVEPLLTSIEYSLFNGGKRFRPLLCYGVADAIDLPTEQITGFAMALECIHTYSLIHDDLPCMDDDDTRRGQPTNHKKFSEDMALLAGDSLLTEAFLIIAKHYPERCSQLTTLLSEGSGLSGMIRGQVLDLGRGKEINSLSDLIHLHEMKTGQLIAMCFQAPAILKGLDQGAFRELGMMLGLAFQVKDDLLDIEDEDQMSFVSFLGEQGANDYLESLTEKIDRALSDMKLSGGLLSELIAFNLAREL